jgi:regulator of replication initiation timing
MPRTGKSSSPWRAILVLAGTIFVAASFASARAQSTVSTTPPNAASPPPQDSAPAPSAPAGHKTSPLSPPPNSADTAAALARLTEANQELLDLLKKQQAVLEDIQFDRRLQSRQISSLEERLEESLQENSQLQAKIAKLEEQISLGPTTDTKSSQASSSSTPPEPPKAVDTPPPPPTTYLPAPSSEGEAGTMSWHRLFTLSGTDGKKSDLFKIQGRQWRVLWHNLDQPGDVYKNTSALFISAFPKDDTIPQNVCSKLGTGGDSAELNGPGEFYLKIEASGGSWELAVEDFK